MDESTLKFHDVAPGGVLSLCIWQYDNWTELVLAAVEGDPSKVTDLRHYRVVSTSGTTEKKARGIRGMVTSSFLVILVPFFFFCHIKKLSSYS